MDLDSVAKTAKKLPWGYIAIGGVGLVVIYMVASSGGGGTAVVSGSEPDAALAGEQLQSQTQLALAGMQIGAQNNQLQYQLEGLQLQQSGDRELAALQSQTALEALSLQIAAQQTQASLQANLDTQKLAFYDNQDQRQFEIAKGNQDLTYNTSKLQADFLTAQLNSAERVEAGRNSLEVLRGTWAYNSTNLANQYSMDTQKHLADLNSRTTIAIAQEAGKTSRSNTKTGALASIANSLIGLF